MKTVLHLIAAFMVLVLDWLSGTSRGHEDPARASIVRVVVKHPWLTAAALAGVLGAGAALVVVSGIVPIKASSGHWRITALFLDFAKVRSVKTHSQGMQPPPLDDEGLVLRGAGHYEIGCYSCHGAPGAAVPPVMAAMTPNPPELMSRWNPEELFSIVKHGIKLTGMPAWPAQQRDDEVWAVVAFLRRMPNLDADEYRQLVYGEPRGAPVSAPPAVRDLCVRCHGEDGTGRGPGVFPSLAGQRAGYLYASLKAFAARQRFSGTMSEIAASLSDASMRQIAEYYESLRPGGGRPSTDRSADARGATIAMSGIPDREIPACAECHGPTSVPKNPSYPELAGQHARYLASQLELLKGRRRGGSPKVNLMHVFVDHLSTDDIQAVTSHYATLPND
jgi:cytochrome c553